MLSSRGTYVVHVVRFLLMLAILLVLLLVSEAVLGLVQQGRGAIPVVLVEATRLLVFAGVLWGAGDIALMLIESNHDLRATRVLLWQLTALVKLRMEHEGIAVEPVEPPLPSADRP